MDDDLPTEPVLGSWERGMHRLAAWMARANRAFEPTRPLVPTREDQPSRITEVARQVPPPRP